MKHQIQIVTIAAAIALLAVSVQTVKAQWETCMRFVSIGAFLIALIGTSWSQEVAFETMSLDTNYYDINNSFYVYQNIDQIKAYQNVSGGYLMSVAYYNKKTSQYDVFIHQAKTISLLNPNPPVNCKLLTPYMVTQTVFNSDLDWEVFWIVSDTIASKYKTILTSATGTIIWTPSTNEFCDVRGARRLLFDGTYMYICVDVINGSTSFQRYYRFHPALTSTNPALSKAAISSNVPVPIVSFGSSGDLKIKLTHSPTGGATISLFNLLGQQFFSQSISDLKKDVTFTIPSSSIPKSPIITQIQNDQGSFLAKSIPVK